VSIEELICTTNNMTNGPTGVRPVIWYSAGNWNVALWRRTVDTFD